MIPFPQLRDPAVLADWAEAEALFGAAGTVSRSDLLTFIRDEPLDDEDKNSRDYDSELEILCNDVWLELQYRRYVSGTLYPLRLNARVIERTEADWKHAQVFAFLLLLGLRQWYTFPVHIQTAARLFEHCVTSSLRRYVDGDARRLGWPIDQGTADFENRVRQVAASVVARFVSLDNVSPRVKDNGLDVVAWRVIPDDRPSNWVLLCQCTIGFDWYKKSLRIDSWQNVIQLIPKAMNAIAFPFVPPRNEIQRSRWLDAGINGGLLFDRLRLTRYLGPPDGNVLNELTPWLDEHVAGLEDATARGSVADDGDD